MIYSRVHAFFCCDLHKTVVAHQKTVSIPDDGAWTNIESLVCSHNFDSEFKFVEKQFIGDGLNVCKILKILRNEFMTDDLHGIPNWCPRNSALWDLRKPKCIEFGMFRTFRLALNYEMGRLFDKQHYQNNIFNVWKNRQCSHCSNKNDILKKCKRCCKVWYCSDKCQLRDWNVHKKNCKSKLARKN